MAEALESVKCESLQLLKIAESNLLSLRHLRTYSEQ